MSNFSTWLFTIMSGKKVGKDEFGNAYFESRKPARDFGRKKRWVLYKGLEEASKIPPQWFSWIHYQCDEAPVSNSKKHPWVKSHTPNLTGTAKAYYPKGHVLSAAKRQKATGDYTSWTPEIKQ